MPLNLGRECDLQFRRLAWGPISSRKLSRLSYTLQSAALNEESLIFTVPVFASVPESVCDLPPDFARTKDSPVLPQCSDPYPLQCCDRQKREDRETDHKRL